MKNIRAAEKKAAKEIKNRSDVVQNNTNHWNIQWLNWLKTNDMNEHNHTSWSHHDVCTVQ